ncbi:MAG: methionine adenosyltransferase [Candidatus Micrarchaeota archaeon]
MKNGISVQHFIPYAPEVELVERKGVGHPDTLIEGIVEEISRNLCRHYLDNFGSILHHNVDKAQIIAGCVYKNRFTKPIRIILGGRATDSANGKKVPIEWIAKEATRDYLAKIVPLLEPNNFSVECYISPSSSDLVNLFMRNQRMPLSNDTSIGTAYFPYSELDLLVLSVEKYLNGEYRQKNVFVGSDIKVMGSRNKDKIDLILSVAFISKFVSSTEAYLGYKRGLSESVSRFSRKFTKKRVTVSINTADDPKRDSIYITHTGTSAEMGDDGMVGRGNRINGLITPGKPMNMEAIAGKNPVNHVGKLYNVLAFEIAKQIADELDAYAEVYLLSSIGMPIDAPKMAYARVSRKNIEKKTQYILSKNLEDIRELTEKMVKGKITLF